MKVNVIYNGTGRVQKMRKVFADILVKLKKVRVVEDSVFELTPAPAPAPEPEPEPEPAIPPAAPVIEKPSSEVQPNETQIKNLDGDAGDFVKESVTTKARANNQKSKPAAKAEE